ncbi:MAG: hypothetical protein O3C27_05995 [Actinomycetota bacterium]|nr:hypothetical protein [Actinomycetota bacterium]
MKSTRVVGSVVAMLVLGLTLAAVISGGPSSNPSLESEPSTHVVSARPPDPCQRPEQAALSEADPLDLVLDAAEAVQARADHCEIEPVRRICRALWLAQQLDPVLVSLRGDPIQVRRADEVLSWAIFDAQLVADPALAVALGRLLVDPNDVDAIIDRAHPDVLAPLRAAERAC